MNNWGNWVGIRITAHEGEGEAVPGTSVLFKHEVWDHDRRLPGPHDRRAPAEVGLGEGEHHRQRRQPREHQSREHQPR